MKVMEVSVKKRFNGTKGLDHDHVMCVTSYCGAEGQKPGPGQAQIQSSNEVHFLLPN